jgi:hypothetical protein
LKLIEAKKKQEKTKGNKRKEKEIKGKREEKRE